MTEKTNLFEGPQKKKSKTNVFEGQQKKKSGKRVVKPPKNIKQMDDNQSPLGVAADPVVLAGLVHEFTGSLEHILLLLCCILVAPAKAMGIHFQEEMIVEILSKLPVQSLLRFKCVSKLWNTLICDPYFKKQHLHHAKNNQNSQKFLVSQLRVGKDDMFSLYCSSLSLFQLADDVQKLDCPATCKPVGPKLYCCYDGLSLIGARNYSNMPLILLLWNPSTRESIVLPNPESPTEGFCTWGLGYDSTSDDYKILKIHPEVCSEILSLKSGCWRKVDRQPIGIYPELSGMDSLAFVHGAFHWLGKSLNYSMVSLSISNNVYAEIPLPEKMQLNCMFIECGVSVLRGMLCCYHTNYDWTEGTFKLWVMKDYGVKESWIITSIFKCTSLHSAIPKCRLVEGDLLLRCRFWGIVGTVFKTPGISFRVWPLRDTLQDGFAYTESLITPKLHT